MGFGLLVYNGNQVAAAATNQDFVAAVDADFSQRNSHYIFTEPYKLLAAYLGGASVTRGRFQVPTWNAIGEFGIFNANRSLPPPSNPQLDNYLVMPPDIPMMEEFQAQASNNLGMGNEDENVLIWIGTQDFNQNLPRGRLPIRVRATATITPTIRAWSGPQAITLSQSLRGGVYAMVGCAVQGNNAVGFRVIFPRYRLYHGRKLRPGSLTQNAVGDVPLNSLTAGNWVFGEWGRFHTFELPQIELFGTVAASITYQIFMDLVYMGEDMSLLNQGMGGGY